MTTEERDDLHLVGPEFESEQWVPQRVIPARRLKRQRCLLGFEYISQTFIGQVMRPFRARGLVIWGAPEHAVIHQCLAGTNLQIVASWPPVPAAFFAMARTYEEIAEKWADGIEPPAWCTFDPIEPGCQMRVTLASAEGNPLGPSDGISLCMWGVSVV